jgi:hypothetical protein
MLNSDSKRGRRSTSALSARDVSVARVSPRLSTILQTQSVLTNGAGERKMPVTCASAPGSPASAKGMARPRGASRAMSEPGVRQSGRVPARAADNSGARRERSWALVRRSECQSDLAFSSCDGVAKRVRETRSSLGEVRRSDSAGKRAVTSECKRWGNVSMHAGLYGLV